MPDVGVYFKLNIAQLLYYYYYTIGMTYIALATKIVAIIMSSEHVHLAECNFQVIRCFVQARPSCVHRADSERMEYFGAISRCYATWWPGARSRLVYTRNKTAKRTTFIAFYGSSLHRVISHDRDAPS